MRQIEERLEAVVHVLTTEPREWRPEDSEGRPGGIVLLRPDIPALIVPDLHGRSDYLPDLLRFPFNDQTVYERLRTGSIQIVCVGDGMHSERRGKERWLTAFQEYKNSFEDCPAMTREMTENFQTMSMVMKLKTAFPKSFHFLKGNHENILDEEGNGNHPFAKFVAEGPMTAYYVRKFYGETFLRHYDRFEKNLPLLARGGSFVITHAQPKSAYPINDIINFRNRPEITEGLTWTRQDKADPAAIPAMLKELVGDSNAEKRWFCGHTSLKNRFRYRPEISLVEIHNPNLRTIVIVDPHQTFDPEKHILDLPQSERQKRHL